MNHDSPTGRLVNTRQAIIFETAVLLLAVALGWLLSVDPLGRLGISWGGALLGLAATGPLLVMLGLLLRSRNPVLIEFRRTVEGVAGPLFSGASWWQVVALAGIAGLAEEALFRGLLQEGLTSWLGWVPALLISGAVFGILHWLTGLYALLAGLVGLYLGALYLITGDLLVPVLAHAAYDVVALGILKGKGQTGESVEEIGKQE